MMGSMLRRGAITTGCAATAEPDVVTGLTATPSGTTTINLVWDADSTASPNEPSEYDIERSNDGSTGWSVIATISAPAVSYSDTTLSASTTRHYRIVAKNCADTANASTSASATTAAGSIAPSWSLDFSSGSFSGATLTRASTGTYVDSSGYIASASTDIARLTHDSSGSRLGLLVEESRTNLALHSGEFENAWYNDTLNTTVSGVASPTAPDNSTDAAQLLETTASNRHARGRGSGINVSASRRCWSVFLKKDTRQYVGIAVQSLGNSSHYLVIFDLNNGAFSAERIQAGTPNGAYGIENYGNGWYRCWVSYDASGNSYGWVFLSDRAGFSGTLASGMPSYTGSTSEGVYVWGNQYEAGNSPSALIPTTTASVTRSADLVHVLDSAITNWGDPGALVVHFYPPGQAGTLISTDDAATAQVGIEASTTTAARAFWSSGSTATGTIGSGVQKAVHYWNGSTSKFAINGGTVQSATNNLTIANTDFVTLGAEATESGGVPGTFSQYANCVIRKVEFYSGTLSDSDLQTITT